MANPIHIMVDIETLSQNPTAAIVSIGACKFNIETGDILETFHVAIDPKSCKEIGLRIDQSTIDWWKMQSPEARNAWMKNGIPIKDALENFSKYVGPNNTQIWSYGSNFDFPILAYAYDKLNMKEPWRYYNIKCARTVLSLAGVNLKELRESGASTIYHDAMADALFQTKHLLKVFGKGE